MMSEFCFSLTSTQFALILFLNMMIKKGSSRNSLLETSLSQSCYHCHFEPDHFLWKGVRKPILCIVTCAAAFKVPSHYIQMPTPTCDDQNGSTDH